MEDYPIIAIPLIFAGMVFTVLATYGFFNVETLYVAHNATSGNLEAFLYEDTSYATIYPWAFFFLFLLYVFLFVYVAFKFWKEAMETKGEIKYRRR